MTPAVGAGLYGAGSGLGRLESPTHSQTKPTPRKHFQPCYIPIPAPTIFYKALESRNSSFPFRDSWQHDLDNLKQLAKAIKTELEKLQNDALSAELVSQLNAWCDRVINEDVDKFNRIEVEALFQEFANGLSEFFAQSSIMSQDIRLKSFPEDLVPIQELLVDIVDELSSLCKRSMSDN